MFQTTNQIGFGTFPNVPASEHLGWSATQPVVSIGRVWLYLSLKARLVLQGRFCAVSVQYVVHSIRQGWHMWWILFFFYGIIDLIIIYDNMIMISNQSVSVGCQLGWRWFLCMWQFIFSYSHHELHQREQWGNIIKHPLAAAQFSQSQSGSKITLHCPFLHKRRCVWDCSTFGRTNTVRPMVFSVFLPGIISIVPQILVIFMPHWKQPQTWEGLAESMRSQEYLPKCQHGGFLK